MYQRTLLLFCAIIGTQSIPAPHLTPCHICDSVCQTKNSNIIYKLSIQGVPDLNIENLDPIYQKNIEGNLLVITYKLYNSTIEGFSTCDVVDTKLDLKNSTLSFDMFCPHFYMYGIYEMYGQLLVMPIEGNGDYKIKFKDYYVHMDTDIKIRRGKDGKEYLSFKSYKASAELKGSMNAYLSNLFNGQKELADKLLAFANKNAKPVAQLLQGPVLKANIKKLIKNFNKYMKNVPLDQLIKH